MFSAKRKCRALAVIKCLELERLAFMARAPRPFCCAASKLPLVGVSVAALAARADLPEKGNAGALWPMARGANGLTMTPG